MFQSRQILAAKRLSLSMRFDKFLICPTDNVTT